MKRLAAGLLLVLLAPVVAAKPMAELDILLGEWRGGGWIQHGRERASFASAETVRRALDGQALLVEGVHRDPASDKTVHAALALFRQASDGSYRVHAWLADGRDIEAAGHWEDGELHWGFTLPDGSRELRYRLRVDQGRWQEIGESRVPDGEWFRFFEMTLEKVE